MVKIVDICSGKGGVGKTTVAANLAAALQLIGKRVVVVDCNLTTSHLSLCLGLPSYSRTLNDALKGSIDIRSAVYNHPLGIKVIPASLDLKDLVDIDAGHLKEKLLESFRDYDVVLLDSAPGIGKEAMIALQASDSVVFVVNPYIPSIVDVLKIHQLIRDMSGLPHPLGIILNRVRRRHWEISASEISQFVELPVIGIIPEDESVLESTNMKSLVTSTHPYSKASVAIFEIAAYMAGVYYRKPNRLKMFIERILGPKIPEHQSYHAPKGMI
jgi:cell division ATPase MinD